jgi:zinc transport system substrate-binding protein
VRRLFTVAVLMWGLVAGCGGRSPSGGADLTVAASVYPLGWLARAVAPGAEVIVLSAGGSEAHDLEMTPGQRGEVQTADVVLYLGPIGYQPQVEEAVASSEGQVLALSEVAGPERLRTPGQDELASGGVEDDGGRPPAVDAHLWFSADVMADAAVAIGEAFARADEANAEAYAAAAEAVRQQFLELRDELDATLGRPCRHDDVVVSHQAYGYLLAPYGIRQLGVTGINPEAGTSSGELADLVEVIESGGIGYVLVEPVEGRSGAETLARETGAQLLEIQPLDTVTDEQAALGLPELVRRQAANVATARGC